MLKAARAVAVVAALFVAVSCSSEDDVGSAAGPVATTTKECVATQPEALVAEVLRTMAHDSDVYTQGLVVVDGVLYESAGRYGESRLRTLDPETGQELAEFPLPDEVFGEGLAAGPSGELVQLTWKEGIAYRWDTQELGADGEPVEPVGEFHYEGEGWGLTTLDDGAVVMSDGSDALTVRDPADFSVTATHRVTRADGPADELNELEWDGTSLWANRYRTDELLRIDTDCWTVTGVADMSEIRADATEAAERRGAEIDVTNGIAHLVESETFLVTGKWWPTMYEVRLVPAPTPAP